MESLEDMPGRPENLGSTAAPEVLPLPTCDPAVLTERKESWERVAAVVNQFGPHPWKDRSI